MTSTQSRRMARIGGSWWKAWWSTGVRVESPNEIYKYAAPLRPTAVVADTTQESWRGGSHLRVGNVFVWECRRTHHAR